MKAAPPPTFGDLVRRHRLAAGLSQEALAERAGLSARGVSDLERGVHRAPQRATVDLLAAALGLAADERVALAAAVRRARPPIARAAPALPVALTSFVGRERELAEVTGLLGATRLLTLIGAGGVGKTRLALRVAADLLDAYPDGVWLVDLAPLADPDLAPQAVAEALGVREAAGRPLLASLLAALKPRRLLLVLDNCEHLLDAGARLAEALLQGCPSVRVLATSREALGIAGEVRWRVPSLPAPPLDRPAAGGDDPSSPLSGYAAVRLFVDRAGAVRPGFAVTARNAPAVAEVCARLDGIPLAIELAAARVAGLAVEQIAARLDRSLRLLTGGSRTALPRHQTLAATVDWSHRLLSGPERGLFRRLTVFRGRFTLEAAEAVGAGDGIAAEAVLDLLLRLVDTSLVVAEETLGGEAHYRLLETLRQYARERLDASGEADAVRRRHAAYFAALAEQAETLGVAAWYARLAAMHDDLRAAQRWLVEAGDAELGLRLSGRLGYYWYYRGHPAEGRAWLDGVLALPRASAPTPGRGRALREAAVLAWQQSDLAAARASIEEALTIQRAGGEPAELAAALETLGSVELSSGDHGAARTALEEALAIARATGDRGAAADVLHRLGQVGYYGGQYEQARAWLDEFVVLSRARDNVLGCASGSSWLGHIAVAQGDHATARARYTESLHFRREYGPSTVGLAAIGTATALDGFANLAAAQGRCARAARLAGAAARLRHEGGIPIHRVHHAGMDARLAACRRALGDEAFAAAWAEGQTMKPEEAVDYALADESAD